ncbi:MAG: gliding motility-associated C-terminal domain-containing protein [Flavobacteriales bacterium]|nr:gliding motility-associated C-terminal domain-containing protein [Flavobacteriales bacterium]
MSHSPLVSKRSLRLLAIATVLAATASTAQDPTLVPTRGKRFWTGYMQNGFGAQTLQVHIMGTTATTGTVSMPHTGWSTNFNVPLNGVAVVNVPNVAEHFGSEQVLGKGVLIQAQDSVNVLMTSMQNFTRDLAQVLPVGSLGTNYRVDSHRGLLVANNSFRSELLIVATEDGTEVRITPTVPTLGGRPAGVPFTVALNAGQSYQIQAQNSSMDLTGTLVEATEASGPCRPFVVQGGVMCAEVPPGCAACDVMFSQLIPREAWGTRYHTVPVQGVNIKSYRVLADQNSTSVSINGGPPILLNAGQTHMVNGATAPVCIQADKPVSAVQFLEGLDCAGAGDPSMVLLSPVERMSKSALYHAVSSSQLNQHSISLVVPPASVGQVTLDGIPIPAGLFLPYSGCADRLHARMPVAPGTHRVASPHGFQLYAFGLGSGESYAASVHDIGGVPVQQDSVVCGGGPIVLNAPEPLANAVWTAASDPSTVIGTGNSLAIDPVQSESYTVSGVAPLTGCPSSFTFHVGVPLTIPTLLTANDEATINVCQYQPVQLALVPPPDPAWFEVLWSPAAMLSDATISDPVATPLEDTWYTVQVTSPSGCGDMTDSLFVGVTTGSVLKLDATASDTAICLGESITLNSSTLHVIAEDRFNLPAPGPIWAAVQGGTVSTACGSVSGGALYFNGNGQRSAHTQALNTLGGGEVRFHLKIANGTAPCQDADPGEDVVLEWSTNFGFSWNLLALYVESAYPAFAPIIAPIPPPAQSANTMFRLRQVSNSGAGQDNWAFDEFRVARYDNTWLALTWSGGPVGNANAPQTSAQPQASGWYTLSGIDPAAGCAYSDSVYIHVAPAFTLQVTNDTTLCDIAGIGLQVVPSFDSLTTYVWTPNNGTLSSTTSATPTATPTSTTTYHVQATNALGCIASEQVTITVNTLLGLTVSADALTLCQGQSTPVQANASGGSNLSYQWTGAGLSNYAIAAPVATPTQTTTYTVTVTDGPSGCSLTGSVTVTVTTGYTANAGPDLTLCSALGHQLSVQHNVPGATYQWTPAANLNAANIQSPTILADQTATYTVTVTDANGCSVSDQVVITRAFEGMPAQSVVASCADAPPLLSAPQPGVSYQWSTGQQTPSITPNASGNYTLTITDAQGCQGITTFQVTLHPMPVVDLGTDVSLCGANSHTLDAGNAGNTILWSTGQGTSQISVNTSGTYSVTVTTPQGCSASDAVQVAFHASPVNTLEDVTACETTPPVLNAGNAGSSYLWSNGATTQTITPGASGDYSVTITTPQNCTATYTAQVTLAPAITVDLGPDVSICPGQTETLDAGNPGAQFVWSNGQDTPTIEVGAGGTYSVTVSNGFCSASDAVLVTLLSGPVDNLSDVAVCNDQSVTLDAGNPGADFFWNTGASTQSIAAPTSGMYSVGITLPNGCTGTFSAQVDLVPPPALELGADTVLCAGQILQLNAFSPASTYLWSDGSTAPSLAVTANGTYSVTVSNGFCTVSDAITAIFNPSPVRMAVRQVFTCLDEEPHHAALDAGNPGSRYVWSTGAESQVILAGAYGWYFVDITNVFDCALRDSVVVSEYCPSAIYVPNTFTPNGDGTNDVFLPVGTNIATMELLVFDRWGAVIFESKDPNLGWDGTYRGQEVKNDIYMWRMRYRFYEDANGTLGMEQQRMGHIQVLR